MKPYSGGHPATCKQVRSYECPTLTRLGSVGELTASGSNPVGEDGAPGDLLCDTETNPAGNLC